LTDGSSDIFGGNYLGLLDRYLKDDNEIPITKLLAVIEIGTFGSHIFT